MHINSTLQRGFTLIEMSIVLVVIGLIVGGILTGRDLIKAAETRATITQVEKYNTAVNTFRGKFNALPGDMNAAAAHQFGFAARGQYAGEGDGNGVLEGVWSNIADADWGSVEGDGETGLFWVDLSAAGLIDGGFTTASATNAPTISGTALNNYFPQAKVGFGNYVYVWSGGAQGQGLGASSGNGINYFGLSALTSLSAGYVTSNPGLSVAQAYAIDRKLDDGLPQSGRVIAVYDDTTVSAPYWVRWSGTASASNGPTTAATAGSQTTCYDNGNNAGTAQQYSMEQNGGAGVNCGLSFQFQ